jgi:hypothetical protein
MHEHIEVILGEIQHKSILVTEVLYVMMVTMQAQEIIA